GLQGMETIDVDRLDGADVERMVRTLLAADRVSGTLLELLAEKSEGNPLYVEEILHQLRETGGIIVEGQEARLQSAEVKVPATIHDIIAARVDRLTEDLKLTLRGASVVRRRFGTSLLSRVTEVPAITVGGNLKELHAVDFVFPSASDLLSARSTSASRPAVGFEAAVAVAGKLVTSVLTSVAPSPPNGSLKNRSMAPPPSPVVTQLVTSRIGLSGKPALPPGTSARAVPVLP